MYEAKNTITVVEAMKILEQEILKNRNNRHARCELRKVQRLLKAQELELLKNQKGESSI